MTKPTYENITVEVTDKETIATTGDFQAWEANDQWGQEAAERIVVGKCKRYIKTSGREWKLNPPKKKDKS